MEDEGRHDDRALGALGTLVISDHNGCFKPNVQPSVRFTQSASASFKEDSLTQFDEHRRVTPTAMAVASYDHRGVQQMSAQPSVSRPSPGHPRPQARWPDFSRFNSRLTPQFA